MPRKNNKISFRANVPLILSVIIVAAVAIELVAAYFYWYGNVSVTVTQPTNDSIVRVDLNGYRSVIQFLDSLVFYQPDERARDQGNPFTYR